jgi:hypothetical protein
MERFWRAMKRDRVYLGLSLLWFAVAVGGIVFVLLH